MQVSINIYILNCLIKILISTTSSVNEEYKDIMSILLTKKQK